MNTPAFECRCIRPGFVALPHRTYKYASVATPCRCGASALSVLAVFMKRNPQAAKA